MNALIRKEARLLLPSTVVGLLLTTTLWYSTEFGARSTLLPLGLLAGTAMLVMLTLDSFGRELSAGTFSQLLSQPIPRERIWRTKTLMLAGAVVLVTVAWCLSIAYASPFAARADDRNETLKFAVVFAVAAYSGGLWTVLLLRQVAAAFWFTVLIPVALMFFTSVAMEKQSEAANEAALFIVLGIYSVAGFIFARRLFLRAQDVGWTGGDVEVPALARFLPNPVLTAAAPRGWRPRAALLKKEFQLHQPLLFMAALLAAFHLVVILLRNFGGGFAKQPVMEVILTHFWVLWLVMPLLIGCAAVAEERKFGTLESQLCLPVKRGRQFRIKLGVALLLCVLLGAVVPALFEHWLWFNPNHSTSMNESNLLWAYRGFDFVVVALSAFPVITLTLAVTVVGAISFYVSTLTRTTLQSLAPAIGASIGAWVLLLVATMINQVLQLHLWRGALIHFIAVPIMSVVLLCLMRWNFKHVLVGWRVVGMNVLVLLIALASSVTLTAAAYNRAWELLSPADPVHGPAKLTQQDLVKLQIYGNATVQLRDGRVWLAAHDYSRPNWLSVVAGNWPPLSWGAFLPGTNWSSISASYFDIVGVRTDGSLWISQSPARDIRQTTFPPMARHGSDNDWKQAAIYTDLTLLKTDGTLWGLGTNGFNRGHWKQDFLKMTPHRLGNDSDWADISTAYGWTVYRKLDGCIWDWNQIEKAEVISFGDGAKPLYRNPVLEGVKPGAAAWCLSGGPGGSQVGICDDGTFRVISNWQQGTNQASQFIQMKQRIQIGSETNWMALAGNMDTIVTLKADGTLWRWDVGDRRLQNLAAIEPLRLDSHTDWIGICNMDYGVAALAADGSLWRWRFNSNEGTPESSTLLGASRKPRLLGNIFASAAK